MSGSSPLGAARRMPYSRSAKLSRPSETACRIDVAGSVTRSRDRKKVPIAAAATPPRNAPDAIAWWRNSQPMIAPASVAKTTTSVSRVLIGITSDLGTAFEHDAEPLHPAIERLA